MNPAYRRFHVRRHRISQFFRQRRPSQTRDHRPTTIGDHSGHQFCCVPRVTKSRVLPAFKLDPQILQGALEAVRSPGVELLVNCSRVNPRGEAGWASDLLALAFVRQAHVEVPIGPLKGD